MRRLLVGAVVGVVIGSGGIAHSSVSQESVVTESCGGEGGPEFFPCAWDARHEGNGRGKSYVLKRNGDGVVVPHWVAHRLRHQ
jgi:hypothetical protein